MSPQNLASLCSMESKASPASASTTRPPSPEEDEERRAAYVGQGMAGHERSAAKTQWFARTHPCGGERGSTSILVRIDPLRAAPGIGLVGNAIEPSKSSQRASRPMSRATPSGLQQHHCRCRGAGASSFRLLSSCRPELPFPSYRHRVTHFGELLRNFDECVTGINSSPMLSHL